MESGWISERSRRILKSLPPEERAIAEGAFAEAKTPEDRAEVERAAVAYERARPLDCSESYIVDWALQIAAARPELERLIGSGNLGEPVLHGEVMDALTLDYAREMGDPLTDDQGPIPIFASREFDEQERLVPISLEERRSRRAAATRVATVLSGGEGPA